MRTAAVQLALTGLMLGLVLGVVVLVERKMARRRLNAPSRDAGTSAEAQGIRPANSGPMMVLLTIAAGCAAAAAVVGFVGQDAAEERNASDDATVNRSTCLSTANADWRASVGVLLVGYVAGEGQADAFVDALIETGVEEQVLDGARTTEEIRNRGVELLASAVVNDSRIGSESDPLCPFVAGNPDRTPPVPDRTEVDVDGDASPEISTTSTPPSCDGVGPFVEGEPGYDPALDGDRDGVACE